MPVKGREGLVEIDSRGCRARCPRRRECRQSCRIRSRALAMQEPQYRSPGVRELLDAVAKAKVPCMSIMNMPPLPYLARIPGIDVAGVRDCYTDATVWDSFDPKLMTLCSPDPQAFRPPEEKVNVLQVRLPTNFKAARFDSDAHTAMLRELRGGHRSGALRAATAADRAAGEAQGARLGVRAARQVEHAARGQLSLRAEGRHALDQGCGAHATSRRRARSTTGWCELCIDARRRREGPRAVREVREGGASRSRARHRPRARCAPARRTSSASTAWCRRSRKQKGMRLAAVDEIVALVEAWLARNRAAEAKPQHAVTSAAPST